MNVNEHNEQNVSVFNVITSVVCSILVIVMLFGSVFIVGEQQSAVVTTFGIPKEVNSAGLHFKIPFLQKVRKVDMTIRGMGIGYEPGSQEYIESESLMITSDYNFVNVDFYVEYRVTDPIKALYKSENPILILKTIAQSCIRDTIGMYPVDEVITTGKGKIQSEIKEKIMNRMEKEDVGVQIVNIVIQDANPPTEEVLNAFKAVETARQGKETTINNANKYKSEKIPQAEAEADRIRQEAEAEKESRINEAKGQVSRFESMYAEYQQYPLITKQRMYYEAMEELLPDMNVVIQDGDSQNLNVLDVGKEAAK